MGRIRRTITRDFEYRYRTSGFDAFTTARWQSQDYDEIVLDVGDHFPLDTGHDDGGPFILNKVRDSGSSETFTLVGGLGLYEGQFAVGGPSGSFVKKGVSRLPDSTLNALGTTAIARSAPTNPAFDASTALGEVMRDGLPSMLGSDLARAQTRKQVLAARNAGSEYLNVEFGWLPLVREITSFASAVKESGSILDNYRRDSGKKIRRRYYFPDKKIENRMYTGGFFPATNLNVFGNGTMHEHYLEETWFSGAFRYHIPVTPGALGKFQQWSIAADRLLGLRLTPETLWNIAPWSWAVDWFSNVGDVMTNISQLGNDGLVLQYGYVMHHSLVQHTTRAAFVKNSQTRWCNRFQSNEWKMRLPATPYGFGINLQALTSKQVAVIAALGLSRT